ncbi:DinB family protein [Lacibacter luteus]|uniref:DinB family protein n=1 Tax=Lacibacter luteus TaxID=2508719 RepID=A0A4Q1CJJ4_9BACT|nr:DinB family protein [Lacibacter luteus]RXK60786.1 DinB family protein [Lacibacter luteus]
MESTLHHWKTSRSIYTGFFDKYNLEQLNKIPAGFNNNLIWNIGHVIAAQQGLVYRSCNVPMHISDDFFNRYKPGTKPTADVTQQEVDEIKELLTSLIEKTETDLANNIFQTFNQRKTGTGFYLRNLEDAVTFNNYHEGTHFGYMLSIAKFI